ncbi:MAG: FAD-binding oxidoreductase [Gammaproteobacteria bacterium]|nr:FAD-binding oxidoreductase [Gammaproteobacteria bacterium]
MPTPSYYRASAPADAPRPAVSGALDAEVCVIGAGFAGLATALGLLERGVESVVILEAEQVGHGASGRNGGFVFGGYSLGCAALLEQLGRERARHLYGLTLGAVDKIRSRIRDYGIACDAVDAGVILANWFDDDKALHETREFMLREFDADWRFLPREELREQLKTERYFGGLLEGNAFHFHPLKYAQGLARVIETKGGRIFEQTRVTGLDADGPVKRVHCAAGTVTAKEVVVCCGGYIERLYPALSRAVLPIATYVMATEPLGERLDQAMSTRAAVYDTRFAFDYYRPLADTRLLWGGRIDVFKRQPDEIAKLLYGDLLKVYPQLRGVKVDYAWDGLMSYARHQMPQLGRLPNGVWHAQGFGGHGVGPTTLAGEVVAAAIAQGESLPAGFERYGLPTTFGPLGLVGAQLTYWYYEMKDWWRQ